MCVLRGAGRLSLLKNTEAQEIEAGATVHLPFDELEPVHLTFDLAVAPGQSQGGLYGLLISHEAGGEAAKCTMPCRIKPRMPSLYVAAADDAEELLSARCEFGDFGRRTVEVAKVSLAEGGSLSMSQATC
jgi:hypothetical protein